MFLLLMRELLALVIHLANSAGGSAGLDSPRCFTHIPLVPQSFSSGLLSM